MIRRLLALVAAVGLVAGPGAAPAHAAASDGPVIAAVDAGGYPSVRLDVDVPAGVAPTDIAVKENGVPVAATVERVAGAGDLEVVLAVDVSGSMAGRPLAAAVAAAGAFASVMPPEVRIGVLGFGSQVDLVLAPTTDRQALAGALGRLRANGETRLYDAVVAATTAFTPAAKEKAVVVLSDGGDTISVSPLPVAAGALGDVHLEAIELVTRGSNHDALAALAAAGHGSVTSASDPAALDRAFRSVARLLVNRVRITYPSTATGPGQITVQVKTATGVAEATTAVSFPAPTTVASTTPPTTAPTTAATTVTTVVTTPATAAPPTVPRTDAATVVPAGSDSPWALYLGVVLLFAALVTGALLLLPRLLGGRVDRRRLQVEHRLDAGGLPPHVASLGDRATGAVDRLLERSGRRGRLETALDVADIPLAPGEYLLAAVGGAAVLFLFGTVLGGPVVGLIFASAVALVAFAVVDVRGQQRRERFAEQLPENLQLMVSTLRAGYAFSHALETVGAEASEPSRKEFHRVTVETRLGRDLPAALHALGERMQSKDVLWLTSAIEIHREVGGNLTEILEHVGSTIRVRQRMYRQIRVLTAEGRISAWVLTALPPLLGAAMRIKNPEYSEELTHGAGLVVLTCSGALLVLGWLWLRRLITFDD